MKRIVALALLTWLPVAVPAQPQVTVIPVTRLVTVGDRVELRVVIRAAAAGDAVLALAPGDFELLDEKTVPAKPGAESERVIEKLLTIAFFRTGDFNVGPLTVEMHGADGRVETLTAPPVAITVRSVLSPQDTDIRPLKRLAEMPGNPWRLLPWALAVLALACLALLVGWWRRSRRRAPAAAPPPPPEEEFAAGLAALLSRRLPQENRQRDFFIELSDLAKRFLDRFYGYNAADLTSAETIAALLEREPQPAPVDEFDRLLHAADQVKFARRELEPAAIETIVGGCRTLVDEYRRRRRLAEQAAHDAPQP